MHTVLKLHLLMKSYLDLNNYDKLDQMRVETDF
jgi:hypothetical protein